MLAAARFAPILTGLAVQATAHVLHVPDPYPSIAAGLAAASPGDTVLVACGTYLEHDLNLPSGVLLRSESGVADCVRIDAQRLGRVMLANGTGDGTRLLGLTLTGGATASGGGGIRCQDGILTVEGCEVVDNQGGSEGGNIGARGSRLTIFDSLIREGDAYRGAGIFSNGELEVIRCRIVANKDRNRHDEGADGGGATIFRTASFVDCAIDSNLASAGAGVFSIGGAGHTLTFLRSSLSFNRAEGSHDAGATGGALAGEGADVTFDECILRGNVAFGPSDASDGGAIAYAFGSLEMVNCLVVDNQTLTFGAGGVHTTHTRTVLRGCAFVRNRCASYGYAVGGVNVDGLLGSCEVEACTFVGNVGGRKQPTPSAFAGPGYVPMRNCVFAFNGHGRPVGGTNIEASCCDVFGNISGDWVGPLAGQLGVRGNVSLDPLFCSAPLDDYHLQWGSPCLPVNSASCGLIGAYGFGGCTSVAVRPESWAQVKAAFR